MNSERLLNVARALRESSSPDKFCMDKYWNPCGTPACAFAHYAHRTDLQDLCSLDPDGVAVFRKGGGVCHHDDDETVEHFDINHTEAAELFSCGGCGRAQTAIQAAEYIEVFVQRKLEAQ